MVFYKMQVRFDLDTLEVHAQEIDCDLWFDMDADKEIRETLGIPKQGRLLIPALSRVSVRYLPSYDVLELEVCTEDGGYYCEDVGYTPIGDEIMGALEEPKELGYLDEL